MLKSDLNALAGSFLDLPPTMVDWAALEAHLVEAFKAGKAAAEAAATSEDGGTCNLDCPAIFWQNRRKRHLLDAAAAAGLRAEKIPSNWWLRGYWIFGVGSGMAFRNTAMCEAFVKAVKEFGFSVVVYYKTD